MTSDELRQQLNKSYPGGWPKTYDVDHETYANVCQDILDNKAENGDVYRLGDAEIGQYYVYRIKAGTRHNGLMFKNVELILKSRGMMK